MKNNSKHQVILVEILKDIYGDPELRTALGFKGETAAMLFYDLPRLSGDLDFDLLETAKKDTVFAKLKVILAGHGSLRQAIEKRFTLFFLLSYESGAHTIKVEISKRPTKTSFQLKSYLGIAVFVSKPEDMVANKLSALLTRKKFAMRDVFDLWFFLKNKWSINEAVLLDKTGLSLSAALDQAVEKITPITPTQILQGLGELLDEKQKEWVRKNLVQETIFYLQLYGKTTV